MIDALWRLIGTISLFIILLSGLVIIVRERGIVPRSVSYYIGKDFATKIAMGTILVVFGILFYSYLLFWVAPTYQLPEITYVVIALSFLGLLLIALFPITEYMSTFHYQLHRLGGIAVATSMLLCVWLFTLYAHPVDNLIANIASALTIVTSIGYIGALTGLWRNLPKLLFTSELAMIAGTSGLIYALSWA